MTTLELTNRVPGAKTAAMQQTRSERWKVGRQLVPVVLLALADGGCVSVNAPDKPIVIELNINIKQEVIYRLSQDAKNTIDENPEIF